MVLLLILYIVPFIVENYIIIWIPGFIYDFSTLYITVVTCIVYVGSFILVVKTERSVDDYVYATCPNFISVLQKIMDSKKDKPEKKQLENRIKRLQDIESSSQNIELYSTYDRWNSHA